MDQNIFESDGFTYRVRVGAGKEFHDETESILTFLDGRAHVKRKYLDKNIPNATLLAVAYHGDDIVAVCALKGENGDYTFGIGSKADYPLSRDLPELGYAVTIEQHRGRDLGKQLNKEIITRVGGAMYATVRVGNVPEERNLRRCHFRSVGKHWQGNVDMLGLWIRDTDAAANCDAAPDGPPTID